jgi:hypothetical protein
MWSLGATILPYIIASFLVDLPQQQQLQSASNTVTWSTLSIINENNHGKKNSLCQWYGLIHFGKMLKLEWNEEAVS